VTLRQQEAGRELVVVTRRPHRDGECLGAEPELERLLHRDLLAAFVREHSSRQVQRVHRANGAELVGSFHDARSIRTAVL
jgi:hypothetical protein